MYKGIIREVKSIYKSTDKYIFLKLELDHTTNINDLTNLMGKYVEVEVKEEQTNA